MDAGPGMADVAASFRDGHSTGGSAGEGLGAVRRGSRALDVFSAPGQGTVILARLGRGNPDSADRSGDPTVGAMNLPMPGEEACGDAWCQHHFDDGFVLMVADGLGHGPQAAEASHMAVKAFLKQPDQPPTAIVEDMHLALKPTRGAAAAVARVDLRQGLITYAGVGNIAGTIVAEDGSVRRMVSHNGTVGHVAKRIQAFTYPFDGAPLVVMASDGLATSWKIDAYPGLFRRHPTLIAGVLYRDFSRGRDDVTVLVARAGRA